jgi:hypothetical protein
MLIVMPLVPDARAPHLLVNEVVRTRIRAARYRPPPGTGRCMQYFERPASPRPGALSFRPGPPGPSGPSGPPGQLDAAT